LRVFNWDEKKGWQSQSDYIKVRIGRNGLGWGKGLHPENFNTSPLKKEGDGKAPQGIFSLTQVFGYSEKPAAACKMPYLNATNSTLCIDDVNDIHYGKIIDTKTTPSSDKSHELMRRSDSLYLFGIVVDYNQSAVEKGAGSCIFLHIKTADNQPTSGCTAMSRAELLSVIAVLDPAKKPVLLQCSLANYPALATYYGLPADWNLLTINK
jgi:D-alanyl-D-alanine dipeptidase